MLQISVDPSVISTRRTPDGRTFINLAITISGISWGKPAGADDFPITTTGEHDIIGFKNLIYPWNWKPGGNLPTHVRIIWQMQDHSLYADPVPLRLLAIKAPGATGYEAASEVSIEHHEKIYESKLYNHGVIQGKEIWWNFEGSAKQDIEFNDGTPAHTPENTVNTGFFTASISRVAQEMPPVNQLMNLVYYCVEQELQPPDNAWRFMAFPWYGTGDPQQVSPTNDDLYYFEVADPGGTSKRCYCPTTDWETQWGNDHPIKIRDNRGNFLGHVDLKVNDVEDSIASIISAVSPYYDLPDLFIRYLRANKGLITAATAVDINNFLLATMRDGLGFGYLKETDDDSMVCRIVRKQCELTFGEFTSLDEQAQINFWNKYYTLLDGPPPATSLLETIKIWEQSTLDLAKWKGLWDDIVDEKNDYLTPLAKDLINNSRIDPTRISEKDYVEGWLDAWSSLFAELAKDVGFMHRVLFMQWAQLPFPNIPKLKEFDWLDEIFSSVDPRSVQLEGIAAQHKDFLLAAADHLVAGDTQRITTACLEDIKNYCNKRVDPASTFYPAAANPFLAGTDPVLEWDNFIISIEGQFANISKVVQKEVEKTFDIPPNLQIRVDELKNKGSLQEDDLNDEIAGHIVLTQRAKLKNSVDFEDVLWRYLNWTKVRSRRVEERTAADGKKYYVPIERDLEVPFVIPAFLAESDGNKTPFLELSNEKLSLIAGHKTYADADQVEEQHFEYHFDYTSVAGNDPSAYALWYGFHYRFAGFIALNSGVLPEVLRLSGNVWNVANADPVNIQDSHLIAAYGHFRRVPVSKVRTEAWRIMTTGEAPIMPHPRGLLPLAFELPKWKGNLKAASHDSTTATPEQERLRQKDQSHYLLSDHQKEIRLKLKKPTTSFWNWYAWLGDEANTNSSNGQTFAQTALERELILRDLPKKDRNFSGEGHLCDPAVTNRLIVKMKILFPDEVGFEDLIIDLKPGDFLSDPMQGLLISQGNKTEIVSRVQDRYAITIKEGDIVRLRIHNQIPIRFFDGEDKKFHKWMDQVVPFFDDEQGNHEIIDDCYLSQPVETWFEAARKPDKLITETQVAMMSELLWDNMSVVTLAGDVVVKLQKTPSNYEQLAYFSRIEVKHQVWSWNGRLDESGSYLNGKDPLDPTTKLTTPAMKWEAWAFSDRPDFSSLVYETNLLAEPRPLRDIFQELYRDVRPGEEKALYYRFTLTAHWRYEQLGAQYVKSIDSAKPMDPSEGKGLMHKWRRALRKSVKTKQLPKPSIRFVIPLTRSIEECRDDNQITTAPLLVVLNDRWFAEAGLAEDFELGIELLDYPAKKFPDDESQKFLNAGNDPILSGHALGAVTGVVNGSSLYYIEKGTGRNNDKLVMKAKGPTGLTFDFAVQTPRLRGCAFIVELPGLEGLSLTTPAQIQKRAASMEPWSLMEVSVRRALRENLCAPEINPKSKYSEWTAKEWVQFLPAIDSFIPLAWRKEVVLRKHIVVKFNGRAIQIAGAFPVFDPQIFSTDLHSRYLVVTQRVVDIGGQPCEKYVATYRIDSLNPMVFSENDPATEDFVENQEGFLRVLMVRKSQLASTGNETVWQMLFGKSAKAGESDTGRVKDDPSAALPMISERVPYKMYKE
jgi:hypothetical protein